MENMRKIINIQAGKPVLVEHKNNIKTFWHSKCIFNAYVSKCYRENPLFSLQNAEETVQAQAPLSQSHQLTSRKWDGLEISPKIRAATEQLYRDVQHKASQTLRNTSICHKTFNLKWHGDDVAVSERASCLDIHANQKRSMTGHITDINRVQTDSPTSASWSTSETTY